MKNEWENMVILVWWLVVALTLQVYLATIIIGNINGKTLWNSLNFNLCDPLDSRMSNSLERFQFYYSYIDSSVMYSITHMSYVTVHHKNNALTHSSYNQKNLLPRQY